MFQTETASLGVSMRNAGKATKRRPWACEALTSKCECLDNVQRKPRQEQMKARRKCLENRSAGKFNALFLFFALSNSLFKEYLQFVNLN